MGRASRSAVLLRALLMLLLLLLLRTRTTRALGPRISVPLGKCYGARQREGSADSEMLGGVATTKERLRSTRTRKTLPFPKCCGQSERGGKLGSWEPFSSIFYLDLERAAFLLGCRCSSRREGTVWVPQVLAIPAHSSTCL